jgi:hypothetical protein
MSSDDHHHKSSHKILEKISNKISALKEDITEAVKDRSHSTTSDHRRSSMSSNHSSTSNDHVTFTLQDDTSPVTGETKQTFGSYGM